MTFGPELAALDPSVLTVDVGGSRVKMLVSGMRPEERRRFDSGPTLAGSAMVEGVLETTREWTFDVVTVGIPAQVRAGRVVHEPVNLGGGWVELDYSAALGRPTRVVNDAAMQAIGSYEEGRMLFLGFGTGLGSAMIVDGVVAPFELGHLPFRKKTYEAYVTSRARKKQGEKEWRAAVLETIELFYRALEPDYVVVGGGTGDDLDGLPPYCRVGDNMNAFLGGFRVWHPDAGRETAAG